MSDRVPPIPPVSGPEPARRGPGRMLVLRRRMDRYAEGAAEPETAEPLAPERPSTAAVGAQLLGEKPRRGLKGGPEVLEQARSTYLQNEYSGRHDRRPRKGRITKTEV